MTSPIMSHIANAKAVYIRLGEDVLKTNCCPANPEPGSAGRCKWAAEHGQCANPGNCLVACELCEICSGHPLLEAYARLYKRNVHMVNTTKLRLPKKASKVPTKTTTVAPKVPTKTPTRTTVAPAPIRSRGQRIAASPPPPVAAVPEAVQIPLVSSLDSTFPLMSPIDSTIPLVSPLVGMLVGMLVGILVVACRLLRVPTNRRKWQEREQA